MVDLGCPMTAGLCLGAIGLGLLLGASFIWLWTRILPPAAAAAFWRSMLALMYALWRTDEPRALWAHYQRLLALVGRYAGANLLGVALGLLPTLLALSLLVPPMLAVWNANAKYIEVYPPAAATLLTIAAPRVAAEPGRALFGRNPAGATLGDSAQTVQLTALSVRHAVCWSRFYCWLYKSLAFEVTVLDSGWPMDRPYIVVRPSYQDKNFLWPFLSDLMFAFFAAFMAGNLITYLAIRRRHEAEPRRLPAGENR